MRPSGEVLSMVDVCAMVTSTIDSFANSFCTEVSTAMCNAFKEIYDFVNTRVGSDSATNPSVSDSPSQAPVRQSPGKGWQDPPVLSVHSQHQAVLGQGQRGSESESLPKSPILIREYLESLDRQGLDIPGILAAIIRRVGLGTLRVRRVIFHLVTSRSRNLLVGSRSLSLRPWLRIALSLRLSGSV